MTQERKYPSRCPACDKLLAEHAKPHCDWKSHPALQLDALRMWCEHCPGGMTATDLYRCSICGHMFVVPTLARLCETSHETPERSTPC